MNPILKRILNLEGQNARTSGGVLSYVIIPHKDGAHGNDQASCNSNCVTRETGEPISDYLARINAAFQLEGGCVTLLFNRQSDSLAN